MPRPRAEKLRDRMGALLWAAGLVAFGAVLLALGLKGFFDFTNQPQAMPYDEFVRNGSTSDRVILSDFHVNTRLAVKAYWDEHHGGKHPYTEYWSGYFQPLLRSEDDTGPVRAFVLIESSRHSYGRRDPEFKMMDVGYDGSADFGPRIRGHVAFRSEREQVGDYFRSRAKFSNHGRNIELSSGFVLLTTSDNGPVASLFFGILFGAVGVVVTVIGLFVLWFVLKPRKPGLA
ncbi:MAG: hypothetical protein IT462_15265 [Planctomycetes bacterium]|nr:hypothetical protein [Planctomycetota bacterium]